MIIVDNKNQILTKRLVVLTSCILFSVGRVNAADAEQAQALREFRERIVKKKGGLSIDEIKKLYETTVQPVVNKVNEEKAQSSSQANDPDSNQNTGETSVSSKGEEQPISITPNDVKPLDFGAEASPKPSSSKFEIDLTDAPKNTSETEFVFEKKTEVVPNQKPSPKASKKPQSK